MAATEKKQMWHWSGPYSEVVTREMAASQGILMPGAPVYISQSGTVKVSDTSDGTGDVIHGFLVGLEDRSATWKLTAAIAANVNVKVALITTSQLYAVYLENNGTDIVEAQSYVGNEYGLTVSATAGEVGYTTLDVNNSNDTVTVVDIASNLEPTKFTTTATPGVAIVRFLSATIEAEKA